MDFEQAIAVYLSAKNQVKGKVERDRYCLARLMPYFSGRQVEDLKRADVRRYVAQRLAQGVKLVTVHRELCLFCAAVNFCNVELELAMPNPASKLGLPRSEHRVRWITQQEAARLIQEAERYASRPHLAVFIRLALNTGCRKGELLHLEWSRVDFVHRQFLLEARHTKARRRRTVPLNDAALDALRHMEAWRQGHGLVSSWVFGYDEGKRIASFKTAWTAALRRAGIENFRIHDLRHTFASWLVMQGESIYVVKDLLGHASVTQTERYAHLAPGQGRGAVQRLLSF
jgi:integrase